MGKKFTASDFDETLSTPCESNLWITNTPSKNVCDLVIKHSPQTSNVYATDSIPADNILIRILDPQHWMSTATVDDGRKRREIWSESVTKNFPPWSSVSISHLRGSPHHRKIAENFCFQIIPRFRLPHPESDLLITDSGSKHFIEAVRGYADAIWWVIHTSTWYPSTTNKF